jgi:integrase
MADQVLLPELERYLDLYRPRLMDMTGPTDRANPVRPPGQFLWITRCGTPMTPSGLQKALARHTQARFGHHVNVHLFRDCVATSLADDDPEHVRIAADLLGHKTFHTTETIYIAANQRQALRMGQNLILARRKAASRRGSQSSRIP